MIAEDFYTFVESLNGMRNLLLIFVLSSISFLTLSQEVVNKTDSKGLKQGKWVSKYPGGSKKYEGRFVNNIPVGEWKRYHENGKIKALLTYRNKSDRAFASLFDDSGNLYAKGVFEGTLRDSIWNFYNGNLIVQTENYHLGKKDGNSVCFDQNGKKIWEKEWKEDLLDGNSVAYYPSGTKQNEISFKKGKKNGLAIFYDDKGIKTMEGSYLDDLSDGDWKMFDQEGKLQYQIKYDKGEVLNNGTLDSLQINQFKQYEKVKGKIPEPKLNESGIPDNP